MNTTKRHTILVSACLMGKSVRYDAANCLMDPSVIEKLRQSFHIIDACPECLGGLPCPRNPSEIKNGRFFDAEGKDVTSNFVLGAQKTLNICKNNHIETAILKAKSPSCGNGIVYDGSFSGKKIEGDGVTAALLKKNGIRIFTEDRIDEVFRAYTD